MRLFKHVFLLFVLAAICYVLGITITNSQLAFIIFFVAGLISEVVFWIVFWKQRRAERR